jgi:hypothetical protein
LVNKKVKCWLLCLGIPENPLLVYARFPEATSALVQILLPDDGARNLFAHRAFFVHRFFLIIVPRTIRVLTDPFTSVDFVPELLKRASTVRA